MAPLRRPHGPVGEGASFAFWHDLEMRFAVAVAVILLAAGCSGDDQSSSSTTADVLTAMSSAVAAAPSCEEDLAAGSVVPEDLAAETGCVDEDGSLHVGSSRECDDGRTLVQLDDPERWGFSGEEIVAAPGGVVAADPDYAAAVEECQGQ